MTNTPTSYFYLVCSLVALSSIGVTALLKIGKTQVQIGCLAVTNYILALGHWLYSSADGISSILGAKILINFTGCWYWFFVLLFMMNITRTKPLRGYLFLAIIINLFNTVVTFFLDKKGVFYTDYHFEIRNGLPYLARDGYTPLAYFYFFMEALYLASAFYFAIRFLIRFSTVNVFITLLLIIALAVPSAAYAVELFTRPIVTFVPLFSTFSIYMLLFMSSLGRIYDSDSVVQEIAGKTLNAAVIVISSRGVYLASNDKALECFPELKKIIPGCDVKHLPSEIYELYHGKKMSFEKDGRYYEPKIWKTHEGSHDIDALWLMDVTERKKQADFLAKYRKELEAEVDTKTASLRNSEAALENVLTETISSLLSMVDAKDRYTSGHSIRVAMYSRELARRLGKTKTEQDTVYVAALMHDVGKIHVPDAIINKPGSLSDSEYNEMKMHPVTGYCILSAISKVPEILSAARWHHERYDGTGYPDGLKGDDIPEIARIIGVADAYDAMTSRRSYRDILPQETVRSEIEKNIGIQFDPEIAKLMLDIIDEDKDYKFREIEGEQGNVVILGNSSGSEEISYVIPTGFPYEVKNFSLLSDMLSIEPDQYKYTVLVCDADNSNVSIAEIHKLYPEIRIIAVTKNHSFEAFDGLIREGATNCIMRPFSKEVLMEIIMMVMHISIGDATWKNSDVTVWSFGWS